MFSVCKVASPSNVRLIKGISCIISKRTKYFGECLPNRSIVKVQGEESKEFLQGIITNDIEQLTNDISLMYTMFLNVQGRVLFDAFISKPDSKSYIIECDSQITDSLINHLKLYKIRKKIIFEKLDSFNVWAIFDSSIDLETIKAEDFKNWYFNPKLEPVILKKASDVPKETKLFRDPRLVYLGNRLILPLNTPLESYMNVSVSEKGSFDKFRYKLGIAEGAEDIPRGKHLPLEVNSDYLHGVSFQKGCYIGQELTARTYHTGVVRKRFMPIILDEECFIEKNAVVVNEKGKTVGSFVNSLGKYGIASLRIEDVIKASNLNIGTVTIKTRRPGWWPLTSIKDNQQEPESE